MRSFYVAFLYGCLHSKSFIQREAKKGFGDEIPKQGLGTGACRAQWAKQAGETSEIARSALRDYASFPESQSQRLFEKT